MDFHRSSFDCANEPFAHGYPAERGSGGTLGGRRPTDLARARLYQPLTDNVNTYFSNALSLRLQGLTVLYDLKVHGPTQCLQSKTDWQANRGPN